MKNRSSKSKVTHDGSEVAKKRNKAANQLSEDEIIIQTVYNALRVPNASSIEKLAIALTSIPEARIDFSHAKSRLINILDSLVTKEVVTSEEIIHLKHSIDDIHSIEELISMRVGNFN